jgi:hypothetical protein
MDTNRIESALNRIKDAEDVIANCKREIVEAAGGEAPLPIRPTGKDLDPRKARARGKRPENAKPSTAIDVPRVALVHKRLSLATRPMSAEQLSSRTGLDTKVCAAAAKQLGCIVTGAGRGTKYALPGGAPKASANPVTGRTRKLRDAGPPTAEKKERKPRAPRNPIDPIAVEKVETHLVAHPEGSNSEAICAATGLHLPIVKAVLKSLGERISTSGAARGTKYTIGEAKNADTEEAAE